MKYSASITFPSLHFMLYRRKSITFVRVYCVTHYLGCREYIQPNPNPNTPQHNNSNTPTHNNPNTPTHNNPNTPTHNNPNTPTHNNRRKRGKQLRQPLPFPLRYSYSMRKPYGGGGRGEGVEGRVGRGVRIKFVWVMNWAVCL